MLDGGGWCGCCSEQSLRVRDGVSIPYGGAGTEARGLTVGMRIVLMSERVNRCSVIRNFRNPAAPVCNERSRGAKKGMGVICAEGED